MDAQLRELEHRVLAQMRLIERLRQEKSRAEVIAVAGVLLAVLGVVLGWTL